MGIAERRLRQKEEVRTKILATAWQIVKEEGWQALSIRKIADAIEYSVPVVYDHFENKDSILLEFAKQGFELLVKKMQQARKKHTDPSDQLRAIADAYWSFAFANKEYYQLMFSLGMASCEMGGCNQEKEAFSDVIMEPIEEILAKNKKKVSMSCMKYHTFWSVLHGLISIKMMESSVADDELNKMVMEDAVNGLINNLKE